MALAAGWAHSIVVNSVEAVGSETSEPLTTSYSPLKLLRSAFHLKKGDWDAFFALFMQVLLQLMVIRQLCASVLTVKGSTIAQEIVLEGILPGVAVTLLLSNIVMVLQAAAIQTSGEKGLTAQPHGINSMLLFAYMQLILRPAMEQYEDPEVAWGACLACAFFSGALQLVCVPFAKQIREVIPAPALFSALAGTSLTFLTLDFTFQIFARPVTALPPLIIIFISFSADVRLPFGLPGGLYALLMGAALQEVCKALPGLQALPPPIETDRIHLCLPRFHGDVILRGLEAGWAHSSVALPLAILNLVGNLASIESAHAAGDHYDFGHSLIIDSVATMFGALVGSPFPTAIFIGHPAYKKMGARTGYLLLNSFTVTLVAISGATSLFLLACPLESVVTVLLWIGITITAQAFTSSPRGSAGAVTIGLIPGIAAWVSGELQKVLTPPDDQESPGALTLASLLRARPELFIAGLLSLRQGYLLLSLVLSSLYHHIEERRFSSATQWALIAAFLSATGMVHAFKVTGNKIKNPPVFLSNDPEGLQRRSAFTVAYLTMAGLLAICGSFLLGGSDEEMKDGNLKLGQCLQVKKASARTAGSTPDKASARNEGKKEDSKQSYQPPKFVATNQADDADALEGGARRNIVSGGG
jgi:AGZA family xanthine/uracil permease-like MFS transporter